MQIKRIWEIGMCDLGERGKRNGLWKTEEGAGCCYWPVGLSQWLHLACEQKNVCFHITSIYPLYHNYCQDLKFQDMAWSIYKMTEFFLTLTFSIEMLWLKTFHVSLSFYSRGKKKIFFKLYWLPISESKDSLIEHNWEGWWWKHQENLADFIISLGGARMIWFLASHHSATPVVCQKGMCGVISASGGRAKQKGSVVMPHVMAFVHLEIPHWEFSTVFIGSPPMPPAWCSTCQPGEEAGPPHYTAPGEQFVEN